MPASELETCVCPNVNKNAGIPFPKIPTTARNFHKSFGILRIKKTNTGKRVNMATTSLKRATSMGLNNWDPSEANMLFFIRINELPQIIARAMNISHDKIFF